MHLIPLIIPLLLHLILHHEILKSITAICVKLLLFFFFFFCEIAYLSRKMNVDIPLI